MNRKVYIIHGDTLDDHLACHILYRYSDYYRQLLDIEYITHTDTTTLPKLDYFNSIVFLLGLDYPIEIIKDLISEVAYLNIFGNFESNIKNDLPDVNVNTSTRTSTSMLVWGFYYAYVDVIPKVITLLENYSPLIKYNEDSLYFNKYMSSIDNWKDVKYLEELFNNDVILNEIIHKGKLLT